MSSEFSRLLLETRAFLNELADNNTRDWFTANKPRYDAELRLPAMALLDTIGADLERAIGAPPTPKLFRPQRDVRFSKDKTPYHLHLHMLWSTPPVGWFLGIGRDYLSAGGGVMGFDKNGLTDWREAIDSPKGEELSEIIADLQSNGGRLDAPELKRVPAPFDKDHPRGELLKRKSITMWFDLSDQDVSSKGLERATLDAFEKLVALQLALRDIF
ncbi:uncharacterized protein (TIGR02453 family) [Shimia isoporae]|uniref:Uncharacterized protein (TIGR02453 family) n=1 Tax=Shimia isoporae TaxID=647720 RepID=A0A4R1NQI6_9RHOB|nr:TIGR02453 family protein [Shimia isoporae]TCL08963.1 uncharacterized protein (TIGR02453 family) [Shimia isoporae]